VYHTSDVVARDVCAWLGDRHLLLATDFDGTLSAVVSRPADAVLSPAVRTALAAVAVHPRMTLAIVSGRRIDDVRVRTEGVSAYVAGLHGLEIAGPDTVFRHPGLEAVAPVIAGIRQRAAAALAWCPAAVLEDKTYALTCHVRSVPAADAGRALGQFVEIAQAALDADVLRLLPGAQVLELLPAVNWHKGTAVERIRSAVEAGVQQDVGVVYLGDDRTDEDAFATLGDLGMPIGVGDRPHDHLIRFRLAGPDSVGRLLERMSAVLR